MAPFQHKPVKDRRWGFKTHGQEVVFNVIADLAADDSEHHVEATWAWVAHVTGMNESSVERTVGQLKDLGFVDKIRGGNRYKPGLFRVNIPEGYPVHGPGREMSVEEEVPSEQVGLFG